MHINTTEPTLTEFFVTETYVVRAVTSDQATDMILDNDIQNGVSNYSLNIQPNC